LDELEAVELKISEVYEDNVTFRFDSEFFKKEYLELDRIITQHTVLKLDTLSSWITQGSNPKFSKDGFHCLTGRNINSGKVDYQDSDFVDENEFNLLSRFKVNLNDILITLKGKGAIGKIGYTTEDVDAIFSRNIGLIRIDKTKISSIYIYLFLTSKFGVKLIEKGETGGTGQSTLTTTYLKNISIPLFSDNFQLKLKTVIEQVHLNQIKSKSLYKEAETILLKELDLLDFEPTQENIAIKSFSESFLATGRLDSEYYQPKYDEIENRITSKEYTLVKNEFNQVKTSFDKSKNIYKYIEIGNINISDGSNIFNNVKISELPANAKINVMNGDLLISKVRPYRGAVSIINVDDKDLIVSGAFTVLRRKEKSQINSQVLQVLLRTNIYKELLLKYNVGTSYPVIKDNDILNLKIPLIDLKIQTKISEKIKTSFQLKSESIELLALAKRAVEVAIEEGEDVALELIGENYE
jgi:restriction endonuclease S subunit